MCIDRMNLKLSGEQSSYLEGFFAGLRNRGLTFSDALPIPSSGAPAGLAGSEDLIPEERIKRELHPLDAYPLLLQHAAANQAPDKENAFRFKWQGLFYLAPNKEGFMARLRLPGGQLFGWQLRELANIADQLTTGYLQITTRANLQFRLIQPRDTPEFLRRVQAVGLHTHGAGADNIRNLTCDPTSGVDLDELIETLPIVKELGQFILNHREFYDLPRKFNVAFHGGGKIPTVEDTNDVGFKAVRVVASPSGPGAKGVRPSRVILTDRVAEGVYFRVGVGGATGHKCFTRDLGVLVKPEEVIPVCAAMIRVYLTHGNRRDRKKARLKHLLETWTLEQYLAETEKLLGYQLFRVPDADPPSPVTSPPCPSTAHPHVGAHAQKQEGWQWIGATVPVGQITAKQLRRLAEIAELYGSGEVRLTVWQSVVIPNIRDAFVETVKKALVKMGFDWRPSNLKSGFVACTGNSYCKFASSNTKGHALELMNWLDKRFTLEQPINVHLTGCPNSCAQHYMGDIGLLGTKIKLEGDTVEGYHIFVGGGFGERQSVGRQLFTGVSVGALKPAMAGIIQGWMNHRQPGETFQEFTRRHDIGRLQELLAPASEG
jgi:ferredoxin-nitrite reductase